MKAYYFLQLHCRFYSPMLDKTVDFTLLCQIKLLYYCDLNVDGHLQPLYVSDLLVVLLVSCQDRNVPVCLVYQDYVDLFHYYGIILKSLFTWCSMRVYSRDRYEFIYWLKRLGPCFLSFTQWFSEILRGVQCLCADVVLV